MTDFRSKREMTAKEFTAALKRHGFKHDYLFWFSDTTGQMTDTRVGCIWDSRNKRIARRSTLAKLIRIRDEHVARAGQ